MYIKITLNPYYLSIRKEQLIEKYPIIFESKDYWYIPVSTNLECKFFGLQKPHMVNSIFGMNSIGKSTYEITDAS